MKTKLKYWYYRNIKFRRTKYKPLYNGNYELGEIFYTGDDGYFLHIGKNYIIPFIYTGNKMSEVENYLDHQNKSETEKLFEDVIEYTRKVLKDKGIEKAIEALKEITQGNEAIIELLLPTLLEPSKPYIITVKEKGDD